MIQKERVGTMFFSDNAEVMREFLLQMVNRLSEAILIVNDKGTIFFSNPRAHEMFDYEPQQLEGQHIEILIPLHLRTIHNLHHTSYMNNPSPRPMGTKEIELIALRRDGSVFPIEVSLNPIEYDRRVFVIAFITDITARKDLNQKVIEAEKLRVELEKEREFLALKEQFISITSHEFRQPLTAILSSVGVVESYHDRLTFEANMERVHVIGEQARHMYRMLEDILTITRMQAGGFQFMPRPLDLFQLCESLAIQSGDKRPIIRLIWQKPVHNVVMDQKLLLHILENVLNNAVKYAPNTDEVEFRITTEDADVVFTIRDHGIGIPQTEQERIFEAFYRARNTNSIDGTGLGLVVVQKCVEMHRGSITIESKSGEGTTVTIRLPMFALAENGL